MCTAVKLTISAAPGKTPIQKCKTSKNHRSPYAQPPPNKSRFVRVKNLPLRTSPQDLLDTMNRAMQSSNLCSSTEFPIKNCVVFDDLGYLGFYTPEMTRRAERLNGIMYRGKSLTITKVRRRSAERTTE